MMADFKFRAQVRPELCPSAQRLVAAYDQTYGSSAPGCCPEALAAVLEELAQLEPSSGEHLRYRARQLRGNP